VPGSLSAWAATVAANMGLFSCCMSAPAVAEHSTPPPPKMDNSKATVLSKLSKEAVVEVPATAAAAAPGGGAAGGAAAGGGSPQAVVPVQAPAPSQDATAPPASWSRPWGQLNPTEAAAVQHTLLKARGGPAADGGLSNT
jgi:hypothetical protein